MSKKRKVYDILVLIVFLGLLLGAGYMGYYDHPAEGEEEKEEVSLFEKKRDTLQLWYTDEAMSDYLQSICVEYNEGAEVRIEPYLTSEAQLSKAIYDASLEDGDVMPDLYITTNDMLEEDYLLGIAAPITEKELVTSPEFFAPAAKAAVTYKDKQVAYPFYYETSVLVYNDSYLLDSAKTRLQAAIDQEEGEAAQAQADANVDELNEKALAGEEEETDTVDKAALITDEEIRKMADELVPVTIEGLETFADNYDAPEAVESIFEWEVSDILFDYSFAGNYMHLGGENGDDASVIDVYNMETLQCLTKFQELNQFFSFDASAVTYDSVLSDFMQGKLVFTIAGTDIVKKLENAKATGEFAFDYGLSTIPDLNDTLKSRSRSITTVVAVNGFSTHQEQANDFAKFLTVDKADSLYERLGLLSAYKPAAITDNQKIFYSEYEESAPIEKLMNAENFWVKMEIAFQKIWTGEDVNETLRALSEDLYLQMVGEERKEEIITLPVEETQEEEYLEEEDTTAEKEE